MAEILSQRQRRRCEDPRAAARAYERVKARGDVEGHQTESESALRDFYSASTFHLVNRRDALEAECQITDSLTKLRQRIFFTECVEAVMQRTQRGGKIRNRRIRRRAHLAPGETTYPCRHVASQLLQTVFDFTCRHADSIRNAILTVTRRRCIARQLMLQILQHVFDATTSNMGPEELGRQIRNLVRLIENHRVRRAEDVAEPVFLQCEIRKQEVVIDDDDVGIEGSAASQGDVAARQLRAFLPEAVFSG